MCTFRLAVAIWLAPLALLAGCKDNNGSNLSGLSGQLDLPLAIDFGMLPVGDRTAKPFAFSAIVADVYVRAVYLDGGAGFAIGALTAADAGLPGSLAAGAIASAVLSASPAVAGANAATLSILYEPRNQPSGGAPAVAQAALTATGVALGDIKLQVTPPGLAFGPVSLGDFETLPLTVHNTNPFPIALVIGTVDGGFDGGPFSLPQPGPQLAINQQLQLPVTFVPGALGDVGATLPVAPCLACAAQTIALSGTGVTASLRYGPELLDFGFQLDGTVSAPQHVSVAAVGNVPIALTDIPHLTRDRGSVFQIANLSPAIGAAGLVVDPGDAGSAPALSFDVSYSPSQDPNGDRDQITLSYKVGSNPQVHDAALPLVGNDLRGGCRLVLTPALGLDFGTVTPAIPAPQVTRTLHLVNAGGAACQLSALALADGGDPAFALGSPDGDGGFVPFSAALTLAAHAQLARGVPVTFTAPTNAPQTHHHAVLNLASNDPLSPAHTVALTAALRSPYSALSPWPRWQHDNANSGQSDVDTSAFDGGVSWSRDLVPTAVPTCRPSRSAYYLNGPIVSADHALYQVTCDGTLLSLDAAAGNLRWSQPLDAPAAGTYPVAALAADGVIDLAFASAGGGAGPTVPASAYYFPDTEAAILGYHYCEVSNGNSYLFNAYQFSASPPSLISAQNQLPTACIDVVFGEFGNIPAVSSTAALLPAGNLIYSTSVGIQPGANPAATAVYIHPAGATVGQFRQSVNPVDSSFLAQWSMQTIAPAIGDDGTSYWCTQGACLAMDPQRGAVRWSTVLSGDDSTDDFGAPVLGNGQLFALTLGRRGLNRVGSVQALDPASGAVNWVHTLPELSLLNAAPPTPWGTIASPALTRDGLLLVPYDDGLYALNLDGSLAWKVAIAGGVQSPPATGGDGTIFVGTAQQGLLALDPATQRARWAFLPPGIDGGVASISGAPAIAPEGVFVTADNGVLYGLH